VIVLDPNLLATGQVLTGLKKNGWVVINSARKNDRLGVPQGFNIGLVDASGIAVMNRLGSASIPIVNTAILGAFSKATGLVGIESVVSAVSGTVPVKKQENMHAARQAYDFTETL
jgi:2-oxoacid:acceptor oxidoreductase gamma subunit (pyruvate/2-ketoisovalerate family)